MPTTTQKVTTGENGEVYTVRSVYEMDVDNRTSIIKLDWGGRVGTGLYALITIIKGNCEIECDIPLEVLRVFLQEVDKAKK